MRHALAVSGLCLLLLVPSASLAAVPSAANSTVPQLVGCPLGDLSFTVIVRDAAFNPVPGSVVILSFGSCPSFTHCSGTFPGYVWNSAARTASAVTDSVGQASFPIHQGGVCSAVSVTADGVPLANRAFASTDQNGDLQVDFVDASIVFGKVGTIDGTADFNGNGSVDTLDVSVVQNHTGHSCSGTPPIVGANAGPDTTVECEGPGGTAVRLDGTASQGTSLIFTWSAPGITFDDPHSATPTGIFPLGTTSVHLDLQSDQGPSQDDVLVTVRDSDPPILEVSLEPSTIRPAGRKLVPIHATVSAFDSCMNAVPLVTLFSITVIDGDSTIVPPGDDVQGATFGTPDFDFELRAKRVMGMDRTYIVCYQARDSSGNVAEVCRDVVVAKPGPSQLDTDPGESGLTGAADEPITFGVRVSPNPVGARASLVYAVPSQGHVRLRIFDVNGRAVATLVDGVVEAGRHTVTFDAAHQAGASLYFYALEANGRRASGKFVMMK